MGKHSKIAGFTIVELLIVVVVIAILAAITIVAYNGISQRANASAVQSATSQAVKKVSLYKIDNSENVPADLASVGIIPSGTTTYQYTVNTSTNPQGFCVTVTSNNVSYYAGSSFNYTGSSSGTVNNSSPTSGACPGHSTTGTAIANYSVNPGAEINNNGYGNPNSSTVTRDTSRFYQGVASMRAVLPTAGTGTTGISLIQSTLGTPGFLQPNTTYVISAYVYAQSGSVNPYITAQGPGRASLTDPSGFTTSLKDQWVRIYNVLQTSASGFLTIYILNNGAATSGMQYNVDNVMISPGSTLPVFADGDSSGWIWTGNAKSSTSAGPAL